jgi:very-short-patch-repair endonuclease
MKTCSNCKNEKFVEEFSKCSTSKDGLNNYCRPCAKIYNINWILKNKETKKYDYGHDYKENCKIKYGKLCVCGHCGIEFYSSKDKIKKTNYCTKECWNVYQKRFITTYTCKICASDFQRLKNNRANIYCSRKCMLSDKEFMRKKSINALLAQLNKNGLNKLEKKGSDILNELNIPHQTQVEMFNKFVVDVLIEGQKKIIQWDGEYWHLKPKRKALDVSQDKYLGKCGYKILRVTDREIKTDENTVKELIKSFIKN